MSFLQCFLFFIAIILTDCSPTDIETTIDIQSTTTQSIGLRVAAEIDKIEKELKTEENQLQIDRQKLREEKQIPEPPNLTDVFVLNVGGEIIATTRETLTRVPNSLLSRLFSGGWEHKLQKDYEENIFLDFNPVLFRHLLDQLQTSDPERPTDLDPPSQSALVQPFKKMIRRLGLEQSLSLQKKDVITFDVGGQTATTRRSTFTVVSNSTSDAIISSLTKYFFFWHINSNTKWKQNGVAIAGGNGRGNQLNQLSSPGGIYVDDDEQCIYIADYHNHRIVQWKFDGKVGQVVAGGNGEGNRLDQLNYPTDVIVDEKNDSLIICDRANRRVVRWPRRNVASGQTIISGISCWGLAMDNNGHLYVSDTEKHEVRRWKIGETSGTIVAGEDGRGNQFHQLSGPRYIFVDEEHSVYVSDRSNHRVMKWIKGAKEGIVVAGGHGEGNDLKQLSAPQGVKVDHLGNVYVADSNNDRGMCWSKGAKEGRLIVGGSGQGPQRNHLSFPWGLSFDRQGHLYVADFFVHRVQKFEIDTN